MLTISINGSDKKLNIGCRTFVSLDVLMKILEANNKKMTLNGESVSSTEFAKTTVKGGDALILD
jgi:hypothetical protein